MVVLEKVSSIHVNKEKYQDWYSWFDMTHEIARGKGPKLRWKGKNKEEKDIGKRVIQRVLQLDVSIIKYKLIT